MNSKITNPYLKQILSEISNNASKNRLSDLTWETIYEARKKKTLKTEQDKPQEDTVDDLLGGDTQTPKAGGTPNEAPKNTNAQQSQAPQNPAAKAGGDPMAQGGDSPEAQAGASADAGEGSGEDVEKAEADAAEAKAKLEKAKAEKEEAEKEIEKNQYVKIGSSGATHFLFKKVLDHAFKTNTIDSLASEMVDKLKVQTPEDMDSFTEDVVTYMNIPGMSDLISSMKTLATKQPEQSPKQEEPAA
jgi:hypothetical protein